MTELPHSSDTSLHAPLIAGAHQQPSLSSLEAPSTLTSTSIAPTPELTAPQSISLESTTRPFSSETGLTESAVSGRPEGSNRIATESEQSEAISTVQQSPSSADTTKNKKSNEMEEPILKLQFLLVSGTRTRRTFSPNVTVREVIEDVWGDWPTEWTASQDARPASPHFIRLLYLGKFLEPSRLISAYGIKPSETATILHLNIRPDHTQLDNDAPLKPAKSSGPCGNCCNIS